MTKPVVLVVDDDAGVRASIRVVLDPEYEVVEASGGATARRLVESQPVDAVVLDLLLPEVDGLEVLQELRAIAPSLPIVILTGVKTVRTAVGAMKLDADDYLTKPFDAGSAAKAAPARAVLERLGIGIDDASNGTFLQSNVHARIHTDAYYAAVNRALAQATTRQEALEVLSAIRQTILSGGF
jgi:DNA-binding NtrC family response regulator